MAKPHKKIKMDWSRELAYVIGIIATDGNLSPSGRHINITSKDREIVENCRSALKIDNKIGRKARGDGLEKKYYVLQFGSVLFYKFLQDLGLHQNKSKTIGKLGISEKYFADFLRGCIDGDGSIITFSHPESKHKQVRLTIASASKDFLVWVKQRIDKFTDIEGGWISDHNKHGKGVLILSYGKKDAVKLIKYLYNTDCQYRLDRKYNIAKRCVSMTR